MSEESKQKEEIAAKIQADAVREASKIQADAVRATSITTVWAQILTAIISAMALILAAYIGSKITTSIPEIILSPTPHICSFQSQTDNETIGNLIEAEADASNTKDLSTILIIFAPNATFYDYAQSPTKTWVGPNARYKDDLFQTTELRGVKHFDILPVGLGIDGNIASYTSGSKGSYRNGEGNWTDFFNGSLISTPSTKYGSEHWILKKNTNGCWVITQMEFDAGHIQFP